MLGAGIVCVDYILTLKLTVETIVWGLYVIAK